MYAARASDAYAIFVGRIAIPAIELNESLLIYTPALCEIVGNLLLHLPLRIHVTLIFYLFVVNFVVFFNHFECLKIIVTQIYYMNINIPYKILRTTKYISSI